jgi:selenocysteine lyase/cysteine desulfurase
MALRAFMPALANKTYFNYGGQGPLPTPSLEAIRASWQQIQELGPFTSTIWPYITAQTDRLRSLLADRCGVGTHRLAFTENVTSGCVLPLWGLPWQPDDELLIGDCEHPGVVLPVRSWLGGTAAPPRTCGCRPSVEIPRMSNWQGRSSMPSIGSSHPAPAWWCSPTCSGTRAR